MPKITETAPGHFTIDCKDCGKPIVESNEHGMFCEDFCGLEESKKAGKIVKNFIDEFVKLFNL